MGGTTKTGGTVETLQKGSFQTLPKQPMMNDCDFVVLKYVDYCTTLHNYFFYVIKIFCLFQIFQILSDLSHHHSVDLS